MISHDDIMCSTKNKADNQRRLSRKIAFVVCFLFERKSKADLEAGLALYVL